VGGLLTALLLGGLLVAWQTIGEGKMPAWLDRVAKKDDNGGLAQYDDRLVGDKSQGKKQLNIEKKDALPLLLRYRYVAGDMVKFKSESEVSNDITITNSDKTVTSTKAITRTKSVIMSYTESVEKNGSARTRRQIDHLWYWTNVGGTIAEFDSKNGKPVDDRGELDHRLTCHAARVGTRFEITIDSLGKSPKSTWRSPMFEIWNELPNRRSASFDEVSDDYFNRLLNPVMLLPSGTIRPGFVWTQNSQVNFPSKREFHKVTTEFTYDGTVMHSGKSCEKILSKRLSVEVNRNEEPKEMKYTVKESNGLTYFDNTLGQLVESIGSETTEMKTVINGHEVTAVINSTAHL